MGAISTRVGAKTLRVNKFIQGAYEEQQGSGEPRSCAAGPDPSFSRRVPLSIKKAPRTEESPTRPLAPSLDEFTCPSVVFHGFLKFILEFVLFHEHCIRQFELV